MAKKTKKTVRSKKATFLCPSCSRPSRVLRTKRDDEVIRRQRVCLGRTKHPFATEERIAK